MSARSILAAAIGAAAIACGGGDSMTGPSGPASYAGEWNGTTSQGTPLVVVVSADQRVTTITVGYRFNGCSGSRTFSDLSLSIAVVQPPPGNPVPPGPFNNSPGFGYGSGSPEAPNFTQVYGAFTSSTTATGSVLFGGYPECGNGSALWTATKR
jgi:hypothetical protein